ncbi:hypothetical protein [Actinoplanes missouriensis]|nr:hypothetical protein [Actinoplanes missouriensis]
MTIAEKPVGDKAPLAESFAIAEYESLRTEILKLIEMQGQLIALTVVAFGTVLSVGFQAKNPAIVLVHPILALILGVSWMNHAHSVCRCAAYIREKEEIVGDKRRFGWETFVQANPFPKYRIGFWGVRAIFAISALIAVVASLGVRPPHGPVIALFVLACLVTAVLFWLSFTWKEGSSGHDARRKPVPDE